MEFANKRQLITFIIYERACNLLFSTNDIYLLVYVYLYCVLRHIYFVDVLLQMAKTIFTLKVCSCQQEARLT